MDMNSYNTIDRHVINRNVVPLDRIFPHANNNVAIDRISRISQWRV